MNDVLIKTLMTKKTRWKQRFENFEKSFQKLEQAVAQKKYTEIERAGLIHFFEFTFELSWKTLKDYLKSAGFTVATPRDVLKHGVINIPSQAIFFSNSRYFL